MIEQLILTDAIELIATRYEARIILSNHCVFFWQQPNIIEQRILTDIIKRYEILCKN